MKITLVNPYSRDYDAEFYINGKYVTSASYDIHGSAGLDLIIDIARAFKDVEGVEFEEVDSLEGIAKSN